MGEAVAISSEWLGKHWVDVLSVCTGLLYVMRVRTLRTNLPNLISKTTGSAFFNGLALAPLGLLFFAAFSESVLTAVMKASPVVLAGASVVALLAILEEPPAG